MEGISYNIITDSDDNTIGFYKDLKEMLKGAMIQSIKDDKYLDTITPEELELLSDLESFSECEELLILSDNNGMGYTLKTYRESLKK